MLLWQTTMVGAPVHMTVINSLVAKRDRLQQVLDLFIPRNELAFKPYRRSIDNQSANQLNLSDNRRLTGMSYLYIL
jgi:hypothetical protein